MSVDVENQCLPQSNTRVVKKHKINQNEAVKVLKLWLMTQNEVSEEELKHVWKGLLCKGNEHLSRCELVEKLSAITEALDLRLVRRYFQVFLMAMRRELGVIDYFNVDKFNIVLGGILCHMHFVLDKNCWDCEIINGFMGATVQRTLLAVDRPQGMNSYFADMYLNEIHCFFPVPLDDFGHSIEIRLRFKRVKDNVFTCLLENEGNLLKANHEGQNVDTKEENLRSPGIMNRLLQLATLPSTLQDNRPVLDKLWREFSSLYQQLAASGVVISLHAAMIPKIYHNVSTQQCLEVKSLSIHEIQAYSRSSINSRQVNNAASIEVSECEHNLNSEIRLENAQLVESTPERSLMHILNKNNGNGFAESLEKEFNAEAEEVQDSVAELNLHHASRDQDVINEVNKEERLEVVEFNAESEEVQDSVAELNLNHASRCQDVINEVNKEERLEVVKREPGDTMMLDASAISNLEQQYEEADEDLDNCTSPVPSLMASVSPSNTGSKKRNRELNSENGLDGSLSPESCHESEGDIVCYDLLCEVSSAGRSVQKRAKRVRFSLKNNLVWKPHNPLPPESLRVPPSATPRGSALKKGVPPGPICVMKKSPRKKPALRQKSVLVAVRKTPRTTKSSSTSSMASTSSMVLRKHRSVTR